MAMQWRHPPRRSATFAQEVDDLTVDFSKAAFTLTELAVILALIAILASLAMLTTAAARPQNAAVQCLNNLRQLTAAWSSYAQDNFDEVVDDYGVNDTQGTINNGLFTTWANNVMTWGASMQAFDVSNTNMDWARKGPLSPYLGGSVGVYRCPADVYLSSQQRAAGFQHRLRTYSMSSLFGHFSSGGDSTWQKPPLNWALPQYLQYIKKGAVPNPAKTWLFIEEHPDSINDGYFINTPTASSWADLPASFHNKGCNFSFVDGHAELRKWLSRSSIYEQVIYTYPVQKTFDSKGRLDFAWYLEHSGYRDASTGKPLFNY